MTPIPVENVTAIIENRSFALSKPVNKQTKMVRHRKVAVFALAVMLSSSGAFAVDTVTAPIASYNMAKIVAANGIITVPFGTTIGTPGYIVDAASTLATGSTFTVGLPPGFLFHSVPVLTVSTGSASLTGGGLGSNTAVFTIGSTVLGGSTVSLTAFSVSGANSLQFFTPSFNPLPMTFQASLLDPQPLTAGVFASAFALLPDFRLDGGTIDMQSPTLGRGFGNNPPTDVPTGLIGYLSLDGCKSIRSLLRARPRCSIPTARWLRSSRTKKQPSPLPALTRRAWPAFSTASPLPLPFRRRSGLRVRRVRPPGRSSGPSRRPRSPSTISRSIRQAPGWSAAAAIIKCAWSPTA